jgi:hypothetical protein
VEVQLGFQWVGRRSNYKIHDQAPPIDLPTQRQLVLDDEPQHRIQAAVDEVLNSFEHLPVFQHRFQGGRLALALVKMFGNGIGLQFVDDAKKLFTHLVEFELEGTNGSRGGLLPDVCQQAYLVAGDHVSVG